MLGLELVVVLGLAVLLCRRRPPLPGRLAGAPARLWRAAGVRPCAGCTWPLPDLDVPPGWRACWVSTSIRSTYATPTRRWLEALVWPENHRQRALLSAALADAAADPPTVRAGDAIDLLPGIAG
jgi:hypothetical protein